MKSSLVVLQRQVKVQSGVKGEAEISENHELDNWSCRLWFPHSWYEGCACIPCFFPGTSSSYSWSLEVGSSCQHVLGVIWKRLLGLDSAFAWCLFLNDTRLTWKLGANLCQAYQFWVSTRAYHRNATCIAQAGRYSASQALPVFGSNRFLLWFLI